jgi:hypothetical protein|tara:strand:+ start:795 stop:953 length:159 start_codon:yes stop_codon:yes gene_type:complete
MKNLWKDIAIFSIWASIASMYYFDSGAALISLPATLIETLLIIVTIFIAFAP